MLAVLPANSLQSVTESALAIKQCLTEGSFNQARAQNLAEQLYKDAQDLIRAEYNSKTLFPEAVTTVAITLDEIVSMPILQKLDDLHRALSKTYRVFIELTWFQWWRQKSRYNSIESMQTIITHSDQMIKLIPKNQSLARFEYSCARQAARFLNPIDSIWFKYLELIPTIAGVAVNPSAGQMLYALEHAMGFAKHDQIKTWYLDVRSLRWLSATVETIYDFMREIFPKFETFEEKGGKYSECLAVICIEFVRNPQIDTQCRECAAGELSQLLSLVEVNKTARILEAMGGRLPNLELMSTLVRKADRYKKTREIIKGFLAEVANNQDFHDCKPLLKERINFKSISEIPALNFGEYEQLSSTVAVFTGQIRNSQDRIDILIKFLQNTNGLIENQAERANAEAEVQKEQQNIERLEAQILALWSFEREWGQAFIEEQKELVNLIQKL